MSARDQWITKHGFVLAAIGSAVGLGNVWRFSYTAGENGGGAFLLIYLLCAALVALPIVIAELSIGRHAQGDAVEAFAPGGRRWQLAGWLAVVGAFVILSYYAVVAGWALKYFWGAAFGSLWTATAEGPTTYFTSFISGRFEPVFWQALIVVASVYVVAGGIARGIERFNRVLMPLLALIIITLAVFAVTLPGSSAGLRFLFVPEWDAFARPGVYLAAMGQAFFSLSVGMAIYITYGSYAPQHFHLPRSAATIAIGDTLFAVVAGIAIFPAVFAFAVDPAAGAELAFITLPQIFARMPAGEMLGITFFFLLTAAALTSMVSLVEVPVSMAVHRLGATRKRATLVTGAIIFVAGVPSALGFGVLESVTIAGRGILEALDAAVNSVLLPVGGLLVALFAGWRLGRARLLEEADFSSPRLAVVWFWLLRTLVPAAVVAILLGGFGLV